MSPRVDNACGEDRRQFALLTGADGSSYLHQPLDPRRASAEEALGKLDDAVRPEPLVVLSDINMPGMDGLALLQEVKRRNAELPVIMVTAYGDDERRRRASEYGAADFVTKPVDFDSLKRQLQQLAPPRAEADAHPLPWRMCRMSACGPPNATCRPGLEPSDVGGRPDVRRTSRNRRV